MSEPFYQRLLKLQSHTDPAGLVEEALGLIVETSRARLAYLELYADSEPTPRFWRGHGLSTSTLEEIRSRLSTGVISSAIAEGETISTPSARMDSRFKDLESVRQNEIDAVLCPLATNFRLEFSTSRDGASPAHSPTATKIKWRRSACR